MILRAVDRVRWFRFLQQEFAIIVVSLISYRVKPPVHSLSVSEETTVGHAIIIYFPMFHVTKSRLIRRLTSAVRVNCIAHDRLLTSPNGLKRGRAFSGFPGSATELTSRISDRNEPLTLRSESLESVATRRIEGEWKIHQHHRVLTSWDWRSSRKNTNKLYAHTRINHFLIRIKVLD